MSNVLKFWSHRREDSPIFYLFMYRPVYPRACVTKSKSAFRYSASTENIHRCEGREELFTSGNGAAAVDLARASAHLAGAILSCRTR